MNDGMSPIQQYRKSPRKADDLLTFASRIHKKSIQLLMNNYPSKYSNVELAKIGIRAVYGDKSNHQGDYKSSMQNSKSALAEELTRGKDLDSIGSPLNSVSQLGLAVTHWAIGHLRVNAFGNKHEFENVRFQVQRAIHHAHTVAQEREALTSIRRMVDRACHFFFSRTEKTLKSDSQIEK